MSNLRTEDSSTITIRLADLDNADDQQAVVEMLDHYAQQPTGQHSPLPLTVQQTLIPALRAHPTSLIFLAFTSSLRAVGIATCFVGLSTFKAKPLINVHDLAVHADFRNRGIGSQLLDSVRRHALEMGCCAVTLEVQADNPARRLYAEKGFSDLAEPTHGKTMLFGKLQLS